MAIKLSISEELSFFLEHSIREMEDLKQRGCITDRLYGHYCWLWLWSAHRDDFRHQILWNKRGSEFYWRRIDRVKALAEKIKSFRSDLNPRDIPFRVGSLNP